MSSLNDILRVIIIIYPGQELGRFWGHQYCQTAGRHPLHLPFLVLTFRMSVFAF